MFLSSHLNNKKLHHAYLIEGEGNLILAQVLSFLQQIGIDVENNSDLIKIYSDVFKIDDARNLKLFTSEKSLNQSPKIFIITANSFLIEAQNSLLKIFEEPLENTHFFIIVPDINALLKTFISRFYLIRAGGKKQGKTNEVENFLLLSNKDRIDFIRNLLKDENEDSPEDASPRTKALSFLNQIEEVLHNLFLQKKITDVSIFDQIFKTREFLRMPGSSAKNLLEAVSLRLSNLLK